MQSGVELHPDGRGSDFAQSLDPAEIAAQILDMAVPSFADAVGVFMLDRLLTHGPDGGDLVVRRLGTRFTQQGDQRGDQQGDAPHKVFPAWGVVSFGAGSPYAECVRHGRPVSFEQAAEPREQNELAWYRSFLVVPATAEGTPNGLIAFARASVRPAFGDAEIALASALAVQAGTRLADASLAIEHRRTAEALWHGMVPADPATSNLEVAGRCLPAAGSLTGGDWYDVVPLPGGRTGVVVGDVMGHGPAATALMAQLRAAAHALAGSGLGPAELLRQLERTAITLGEVVYATCVYAVVDPAGEVATIALAGHLPPVLAKADGVTYVPELPTGLSLGLGSGSFGEVRVEMAPGTVLALFTDGLVETRSRSFDLGVAALRDILAGQHRSLDHACEAIIGTLAPDLEDDTTVVLVRIPVSARE